MTETTDHILDWRGAFGLDWLLEAGTYWVSIEESEEQSLANSSSYSMPTQVPNPVIEAIYVDNIDTWEHVCITVQNECVAPLAVASGFRVATGAASTLVTIDIKPGSDPVCNGVIPVAILGSDTLDVTQIDQVTLSFEGEVVRVRGNGALSCNIRDANRDGYTDLVCQYEDTTTEGTLTGKMLDGSLIEGADTFCLGN